MLESGVARTALDLYGEILAAIAARGEAIEPRPLASHWPHVGSRYHPGGLLVAGQALQGWDPRISGARWRANDAATVEGRTAIIERSRTWFSAAPEPVGVVAELGSRARSPFWRLAHDLADDLAPGDGVWYSRFAWANLYPVSFDYGEPNYRGDSPWGALKEAQDPLAGRLFASLVHMLDPGIVVVVPGPPYWRQTAAAAGLDAVLTPRAIPLLAAGIIDDRRWVVGYHPNGTRHLGVKAADFARTICDEVAALGR